MYSIATIALNTKANGLSTTDALLLALVLLAGAELDVDDAAELDPDVPVDDPPTITPPPVAEGELRVALDMVVFRAIGMPVPPELAAVPTVVVTIATEEFERIDDRVPLREERSALIDFDAVAGMIGTGSFG